MANQIGKTRQARCPIRFQIDDLLALESLTQRERASRIFSLLRAFLDIPAGARNTALTRLTESIELHQERDAIHAALRDFWSHHSYVRVISEAGLPDEAFLLRELLSRALRHLLPVDEVGGDLYVLLDSLDLNESDARWLGTVPEELLAAWADIFRPTQNSILASSKILALRAANIALSRDMIEFSDDEDITRSPFFHLPSIVERAVLDPAARHSWAEQRIACETQLNQVNRLLAEKGSSVDLIFRVRLLRSLLGRIHQVIALADIESAIVDPETAELKAESQAPAETALAEPADSEFGQPHPDSRKLAIAIVHGFASQRRFGLVLSASTRRLARSVVEKTGRTGHHYIAKNTSQWRVMGLGAVFAGVITAFTALFKYILAAHIHAPMLLAIAHSFNYIVSFLAMQAGGFLLASKMPAATAAALVDAMEDPEKDRMASLKAISRTQVIVTIANLVGAIPVSILVDRIYQLVAHHPFLDPKQADHGVRMLFPHTSGTIFFAASTGVFLWLSSLATGWTANYLALHKMADAVGNSIRIRRRFGAKGAAWLSNWAQHHAAGSVGFIVLGTLLGAMPIFFALFGIPFEVRHVTLAAAGLGYALDAQFLAGKLNVADTLTAASGIAFVGILNIVTSFALSFLLAVRARNIGDAQSRHFMREVGRELIANPLAFLLPRP